MKLRFLAAAGDADALATLAVRLESQGDVGLKSIFTRPSLCVWAYTGTPRLELADSTGVLIGTLFRKVDSGQVETLAPGDAAERTLIDAHWGAYVLLREVAGGHIAIRDPSGALNVYHGDYSGLDIYASDSALLQRAWPRPLTPSLDYLRHWLAYPFLRGRLTGDDAISELLPGERRQSIGGTARLDPVWSPLEHVRGDRQAPSFEEAAEQLRRSILNSVPRFAQCGKSVVLQLSGGLDSSIIAAAMARSGVSFRAVTFATRSADGDERRYARIVAEHFGIALTELVEPVWTPDFDNVEFDPLRPPPNPMMQPYHRAVGLDLAVSGADILLDGGGGDNVLGRISTAAPALDAFRQQGIGTALRAAREIAELHGCTIWTVLRAAARRAWRGRIRPWPSDLRFLNRSATWPPPQDHPWLASGGHLPAGKADQLGMIVGIRHFFADQNAAWPATFHPLLSQPLLETCLGMPTWLNIRGGQERAVARQAFRGILPDAILDRKSKGRFESIFLRAFTASRSRLESFLMDGRLHAAGLLDAKAVSAYLRQTGQPRDHDYLRLLEIVAAEQWLRSFGR